MTASLTRITVIITLGLFWICGCSTPFTKMDPVLSNNSVAFFKILAVDYPAPQEVKEALPQAIEFPRLTPEKILDILGNLKYRKETIWSTLERRVFYEKELKDLAPMLAEVLPKLDVTQRLVIISRFDPDRSVLSRMERVTALLWADKDGLNIVLGEIREEIPHNDFLEREDWTSILPISLKQAYPDLGLVPSQDFQFKSILGYTHKTWAVFSLEDLDRYRYVPESGSAAQDKTAASQDAGAKKSLTERLKDLQSARDAHLISDEEYETKRSEILKSH